MNKPYDPNVTSDVPSTSAEFPQTLDSDLAKPPLALTGEFAPQPQVPSDIGQTLDSNQLVPPQHPSGNAPANYLPEVPGYRVLREIARGGMGCILAAYDLTLDREVALKLLLPGANADRFVRESKITARLPHPGIPPVHALGTLVDGSPFLAMKLIAGRTLADEMKSADRPRLLQAFAQVCQAVGFAHSRGIIHRDLKPANVMVGSFGEVQVMDWGLAKDLASRDANAEPRPSESSPAPVVGAGLGATTDHRAAGTLTDEQTQAGQVMGTPAYMAPEQARGEVTDARADVFALGGILCAILTGQPPFSGPSILDVIRRAGAADLGEANTRLDRCGADAELLALCRRCLSPDPAERPANGQEVADGLTAYLDGVQQRLRTAERERAVALGREAEQRKRRRVQLVLAAAVVLLLAGAGAFAWWQERQASERRATEARLTGERDAEERNKRQQARQSIDADLKLATELRKQYKFEEAGTALAQAREMATGGAPDRLADVEQAIRELALVVRLDDIRFRKWVWIKGEGRAGQFNHRIAAPAYRREFDRHGLDLLSLSPAAAAKRIAASAVKAELIAALDDWALHEPEPEVCERLLDVARQADPGPLTDRLRDPAVQNDADAVKRLSADVDPAAASAANLSVLSELMFRHKVNPVPLLSKAHAAHPADFELAFSLGGVLKVTSKNFAQVGPYEAARALRPNNPSVWVNLGSALEDRGDVDEAVACYRQAIALDPNDGTAHYNLARILGDRGEVEQAMTHYRKAIAANPKYAEAHVNMGGVLYARGELDKAIACYEKAIESDPKLPEAHYCLGLALSAKGKADEAIACYERTVACDPKHFAAHYNLGVLLGRKGKLDEAIACYEKVIALDPNDARPHNNLGRVLIRKGKVDEAIGCYRKAIVIQPKLLQAHANLGYALHIKGELDEAIASLHRALTLDPEVPYVHEYLGQALHKAGRRKEAIKAWSTAVRLDPEMAMSHLWLGKALLLQGRPGEALGPLGQAAKLLPANVARVQGLAAELSLAKRLEGLEKRLPAFLAGTDRPGDNRERLDVCELLRRQERFAAAARFWADAFAADPKAAEDLNAAHRYNAARSAALAAAGKGEDAGKLDDKEQARLRKQALDWLKADLALHTRHLESGRPADRARSLRVLKEWQGDTDFAGLRDKAALEKLPPDKQKAFSQLWADVAALLKKAEDKSK
jgi:tetratricopeptide (TPR) repeat protein/serine/threonine protein kinase